MPPDRLSNYPYVLVRVRCSLCDRAGQYRLARLAAKWGSELGLDELLDRLASTCPYPRPSVLHKPRKYQPRCGIYLCDLERDPPLPPDRLPASGGGYGLESGGDASIPLFRTASWRLSGLGAGARPANGP